MKAINRKIGIGILWNLAGLFLTRGATTIFTLFLARLLAPDAFGLVAMATVVFELANVFVTSGLGQALIRSKQVSDIDLSTAFYSNLVLSALAYGLVFWGAPYVANFYDQPELTVLIQVMGLVVFFNATKVVQIAVLSREMDFKSQMTSNTAGAIGAGILSVAAAYLGAGVWSLVIMMLSQALITSLVLWLASSWRPSTDFSIQSFRRLFHFGRNLLVEGLLEVLFQNSYVLVIGRVFSAETTGLYFFAKKVANLISQQLTGAVQQATYPALSSLQDDNLTLKNKYRQIMQIMMFLIAPIMALLAGLAPALFGLMFDEKWQDAAPLLQLLCVVGALYPMHALNVNLLNVKGRSDLVLKIGLLKKGLNLALLFLAIPYGVLGILISQILGSMFALIPNTYYSWRLIDYSPAEQLTDAIKPLVSGLLSGFYVSLFLTDGDTFGLDRIILAFLIGGCLYCLLSFIVKAHGMLIFTDKMVAFVKKVVSTKRTR